MFMCGCWFQHILTIQHPTITSGEIPKLIPFWADVSSQIPDKPIIWSCFFSHTRHQLYHFWRIYWLRSQGGASSVLSPSRSEGLSLCVASPCPALHPRSVTGQKHVKRLEYPPIKGWNMGYIYVYIYICICICICIWIINYWLGCTSKYIYTLW